MSEPAVVKGHTECRAASAVSNPPALPVASPFLGCGGYRLRFAVSSADLDAAFRLRFLVFNLELNEGLESAYRDGLDRDAFDDVCDHLLVEHRPTDSIVGTYRLQTGAAAAKALGYYSSREFDFTPYESLRSQILEVGRAAIHRDHRSFEVLTLLWRGIARYALQRKARYLLGCSSLTSQAVQDGAQMYWRLQEFLAEPNLRTVPQPAFRLALESLPARPAAMQPPRLLRAYLAVGAKIAGPPAIDREFRTIDFLTILDLERLVPSAKSRFLGIK